MSDKAESVHSGEQVGIESPLKDPNEISEIPTETPVKASPIADGVQNECTQPKEQTNVIIPESEETDLGDLHSAKESLLESTKPNGKPSTVSSNQNVSDIVSPSQQNVSDVPTVDTTPLDKRKGWRRHLRFIKKNESIVLMAGLVVFLLGCIFLAVGAYMMQSRCMPHSHTATNTPGSAKNSSAQRSPGLIAHTSANRPPLGAPGDATSHNDSSATVSDATNLALGRPAKQSSTASTAEGLQLGADLAVDGNLSSYKFHRHSCSQTASEAHPSWYVDLGGQELVKRVKIILPTDCCGGDLHNFEVRIGQQENLSLNSMCRYYLGTALRDTLNLECERPTYGRYVSVEILGDDTRPRNVLTLCEVMVFQT